MLRPLLFSVLIEFGPIIAFLIASETTSFICATAIFVGLTALALVVGIFERKAIAWFPLIVAVSVISFGVLTIVFHDPFFIMIKDTLYNGGFAVILFAGLLFGRPLLKPLFSSLFAMTDKGWKTLTWRWTIVFAILAVANEVARAALTPEAWAMYKGVATAATIVFSLTQFPLARKERLPEASAWGMRIPPKKSPTLAT